MRNLPRYISVTLGCLLLVLWLATPVSALNTLIDYTSYPPVISESTKPNVLVMISNDHTGFYPGYNDLYNYDNDLDYWGYFDPRKEYSYKSGFVPEDWTGADHYTSNSNYWSGNFLNWVTMTHADFLRKALTGGQRRNDATAGTTIVRGDVPADHAWKKQYSGADIVNLVPSAYANTSNFFSNLGEKMDIQDSGGGSLTKKKPLTVLVNVCDPAMPESNCTPYPAGNSKPEGLLQRYHDKMLFGLMSYSHSKPDRGGVLRTKISDLTDEFSQVNGGDNSSADSMLLYISRYTQKGWDPLSEMLYDGIRYLRGNEGAQAGYCPASAKDDNFFYFGCSSTTKWVDPLQTWCQKNSIIIINDEYPSRDGEEIPNSAFANYSDSPAVGTNTPYNPDVTAITNMIGDNEGITGNRWAVGDIIGNMSSTCTPKTITAFGEARGMCPAEPGSDGTFYLAALAYDAFTSDMRPDNILYTVYNQDTGKPQTDPSTGLPLQTYYPGKQSIRTYGIAFRASPSGYQVPKPPINQMWLAGKYGNFDDKNGNNIPDLDSEWMKSADTCNPTDPDDKDCLPKGFFYAEGGDDIERAIVDVFESILRRAASGTAVSVLATSGQGEGNLVQAYYRPAISEGERDIKWTGYLQSLWVDSYGNIREDTDNNMKLEEDKDNVVKYFLDTDGTTRVRLYEVDIFNPYPDLNNDSFTVIEMGGVNVVWEGGQALVDTPAADRIILTGLDTDNDGVVETSETISLEHANEGKIRPYLALQNDAQNLYLGKTETIRANNLISYIRGNDPGIDSGAFIDPANVVVRDRVLGGEVWKLGDIIQSTPVSIAEPAERFDLIYNDSTYSTFYNMKKDRETMVYVGANDGMLHAFTSWEYNQDLQQFVKPSAAGTNEVLGSEVWAYVPQNLLPHLKWLARPDYTHVFYMDLQPRIFDARIFADDGLTGKHPFGWGTVMIVGMNTGGGLITVTGDFDYDGVDDDYREFKPSYAAFDITDPRDPELLWERTYDGLGFSMGIPAVIRVEDGSDVATHENFAVSAGVGDWYLMFGNGPDSGEINRNAPNYLGETDDNGRVYIVDIMTGKPYSYANAGTDWWMEVADELAFFNSPMASDRFLNYNVDAAYISTTFDANKTGNSAAPHDWKGSVYRLLTYQTGNATHVADPAVWRLNKIFDSPRPITSPGNMAYDHEFNLWVYYGTGRYLSKGVNSDEVSTEQEYVFGIKDPVFNNQMYAFPMLEEPTVLATSDLLDASNYLVLSDGWVFNGTGYETFDDLLKTSRHNMDGWLKPLPVHTFDKSGVAITVAEKSLNEPTVIGGIAFFSTFVPQGDVCDYGGSSTLWALYYETGTAYKREIFQGGIGEEVVTIGGVAKTVIKDSYDLGSGTTSSVGVHLGKQNENVGGDRYVRNPDGTFTQDPNGTYVKRSESSAADRYIKNPDGTYTKDPTGTYVQKPDGSFTYDDGVFTDVGSASLAGDMITGFVQQGTGAVEGFEAETALKFRSGMLTWEEQAGP